MPSIEDLPFEILSEIPPIATQLNSTDTPSYTYGLTQEQRCYRGRKHRYTSVDEQRRTHYARIWSTGSTF